MLLFPLMDSLLYPVRGINLCVFGICQLAKLPDNSGVTIRIFYLLLSLPTIVRLFLVPEIRPLSCGTLLLSVNILFKKTVTVSGYLVSDSVQIRKTLCSYRQ